MKQLIRQAQKIDTYTNWNKTPNFVPLKGEFIIYQEENKITRFKVGDGETFLSELPFTIPETVVMTETNGIQASQIKATSVIAPTVAGTGFSISQNQAYINNNPTDGELITRKALNYWWTSNSGNGTPAQKEIEWANVQHKPLFTSVNTNSVSGGGTNNSINGNYSLIFGTGNVSNGNYSYVFGYQCKTSEEVSNTYDFLGGFQSQIGLYNDKDTGNSNSCFCFGYNSSAQRDNAIAIGRDNLAYGNSTVALGRQNKIISEYNDSNNQAMSHYSSAIGYNNTITISQYAHILGNDNKINSNHSSILIGNHLTSTKANQFIIGQYNDTSDTTSSFVVGLGNKTIGGKNILALSEEEAVINTNVTINGILKLNDKDGNLNGFYIGAEELEALNLENLNAITITWNTPDTSDDIALGDWANQFANNIKTNVNDQIDSYLGSMVW